ncbi:MAG: type VI secretion system-associated FHA domain protein TagH, partial [Gammaproteobacteria bacterium]|nr:type VI secretion system-associated FHA domain protein TagH [Gammaproteobacteria bacterium]
MSLILKVTSPQHKSLGVDSAKSFNQQGGSIGRSQENDWVLPDPDRFVSSRHIAIDYRDGVYFLRDTSANGVYINDWEHPIDRDQPAELKNGDIIAIGNYEIEVSLAEPIPSQLAETDPLAMLGGLASVPPDPFAQKAQSQPPLVPEPPPTSPVPRQVIHPGVSAHGAREHISEVLDPLELMDAPGPHTSQKMDTGPIGDDFWDTEMDR